MGQNYTLIVHALLNMHLQLTHCYIQPMHALGLQMHQQM